eukprot:ANDGO_03051.mRNA.1 hypothetical protein
MDSRSIIVTNRLRCLAVEVCEKELRSTVQEAAFRLKMQRIHSVLLDFRRRKALEAALLVSVPITSTVRNGFMPSYEFSTDERMDAELRDWVQAEVERLKPYNRVYRKAIENFKSQMLEHPEKMRALRDSQRGTVSDANVSSREVHTSRSATLVSEDASGGTTSEGSQAALALAPTSGAKKSTAPKLARFISKPNANKSNAKTFMTFLQEFQSKGGKFS